MQYVAVFCYTIQLITIKLCIPNFRILTQVVKEKYLTEKSLQTDTNIITEKAKTIYPERIITEKLNLKIYHLRRTTLCRVQPVTALKEYPLYT